MLQYFIQVIEDEKSQPDAIMTKEDLDELLSEEWTEPACRASIFGYPTRPLYREVGNMLQYWFNNKLVSFLRGFSIDSFEGITWLIVTINTII